MKTIWMTTFNFLALVRHCELIKQYLIQFNFPFYVSMLCDSIVWTIIVRLPISCISSEVDKSAHAFSEFQPYLTATTLTFSFQRSIGKKATGIPDRSKSPSFCVLPCVSIYVFPPTIQTCPCETELNHRAAQTMENVSRLWEGLTSTSVTKTSKTNAERCLHLLLFVSARGKINEDHLFAKAMTAKTWRHRIMSAMCAVSGSFTWRFLDRVGLAMMDIVLVIPTLLNCVRLCGSQKDVHHRGVFMRRSGSGWIPQISDMASH